MKSKFGSVWALAAGMIVTFAATALILRQVIPGPYRPTDYLVIGTVATFAALAVLCIGVLSSRGKEDPLFKRRKV